MGISLEHERELAATAPGVRIIGIDEAGRGPLAGPVFAAAVSVPLDAAAAFLADAWSGVNDSKKLTPHRREALAAVIKSTPGCRWAVASASTAEIDEINILRATHLAMCRAADDLADGARDGFRILVDGFAVPGLPFPSRNLVRGDAKSLLIAAASILAKTSRDAYCQEMEKRNPGYGFAIHKGYPTAMHLAALARLGPCPEHRRSFGPVRAAFGGGAQ